MMVIAPKFIEENADSPEILQLLLASILNKMDVSDFHRWPNGKLYMVTTTHTCRPSYSDIPDWHKSLDEMHKLEVTLQGEELRKYNKILRAISSSRGQSPDVAMASAHERLLAYLLTILS